MPIRRYEIKQFRGYYQGISPTRFQGQGLNDEYNPGYSYSSGYVDDTIPTPYGELRGLGGPSSIMFSQWSNVNAMYYWTPPRGGDYILIANEGRIFNLQRGSGGWYWQYLMTEETTGSIPVGDEFSFGCFEPYGDALYYADGVNPPLRITLDDTGWLTAKFTGVPVFFSDFLAIDRKPIAALSSVPGASFTYAVTTLSKWGESPASSFRFRNISTTPEQSEGEAGGPTGFSPTFIIDWTRVDSSVTHVNLYRDSVLGKDLQFVARVPRGVSSYVDSARDSDLGYGIPLDNGKPANFRLLRSWNDQMFAVGGYGKRNRISVSKVFYPDVWPPQYEIDTGVIGEGEDIVQLWVINGTLYVFCREKTFRISGFSAEDYSLDLVSSYLGCAAPRSLQPYKNGVVLLTTQGVKFFNGSSYEDISQPIDAVLRIEAPGSVPTDTAVGAVTGDFYYLCMNISGLAVTDEGNFPNRTWVCDLRSREWGVKNKGSFYLSTPFRSDQALIYTSKSVNHPNRYIMLLSPDYDYDDHKRTIPRMVFKALDFDLPDVDKTLKYVDIHYEALKECVLAVVVHREAPQIDDEEATYAPTFSQTVTVEPTNTPTSGGATYVTPKDTAKWGGAWASFTKTGAMKLNHARVNFHQIAGRSFTFYIRFQAVVGPLILQKLVFVYDSQDPEGSSAVLDPPGYGGQ
jgi:hypothetical protein